MTMTPKRSRRFEPFLIYEHPLSPKAVERLVEDLIWADRLIEARDLARSMMRHYNRRMPDEDQFGRQDRFWALALWLGKWTVLTRLVNLREHKRLARHNKRKKAA